MALSLQDDFLRDLEELSDEEFEEIVVVKKQKLNEDEKKKEEEEDDWNPTGEVIDEAEKYLKEKNKDGSLSKFKNK